MHAVIMEGINKERDVRGGREGALYGSDKVPWIGFIETVFRAVGRGCCPEGRPRTCCPSQWSSPPHQQDLLPSLRSCRLALEPIARESLLALALLVCRVAHLLAGGHKTTLGDVLASCLHSITLLVLGRLAMPSTLLWIRG